MDAQRIREHVAFVVRSQQTHVRKHKHVPTVALVHVSDDKEKVNSHVSGLALKSECDYK